MKEIKNYYFYSETRDRIGNRFGSWHKVKAESKARIKRRYGNFYGVIKEILTEEQFLQLPHMNEETIKNIN